MYLGIAQEVVAPDLIMVEVAQAIVRRVNTGETIAAEGRAALRSWRAILDGGGIRLLRTLPSQVEAAGDLAIRLGHPVKDCIYLLLAMERDSMLMTCDVKFAAKARVLYPAIRLLSDYDA
ncbi:type II toxin-antitoxin system VapC family toxin [Sphingomonas sp. PB4P5]|uniref:type II toxin-antitoxin system VapC family toxin n=1 Tax=Parasphingomonas puruogangriensis TaxID=3096155 RepID=UPI002FCA8315